MVRPIFPQRLALLIALLGCASIGVEIVPGSASAQELEAMPVQVEEASGGVPGPIEGAAAQAILYGPLPSDPAELARRKALAAQEFGISHSPEAAKPPLKPLTPAPSVLLAGNGVSDSSFSPSDSTGAIGTGRYIELVNSQVGIYDRSLTLLKQDNLDNLFNESGAENFDVQIIWDAETNRFYYAGDSVFSDTDNRLAWGFSTTATPSNATTDWCHYEMKFKAGADFPDYPKLGDSAPFIVIGVNLFSSSGQFATFVSSAIAAISKPPAGTTCPAPSTFKSRRTGDVSIGGIRFFTPVPANEIDDKRRARIVARKLRLPTTGATKIGLFSVTANANGFPVFPAGSIITVAPYDVPAAAPQKGTFFSLNTLDARMTQAVAAIDPLRGKFAVWTQHTIKGGAGSRVRWYEIYPAGNTLLQSGNVKSPSLFYFNAAISPDRVVNGSINAFGSNMLLSFDASSANDFESIEMVSKRGSATVSLPTIVQTSTGPDTDFTCFPGGVCRWGDYAAVTPDPNSPTTGPAGIIWGTSMWTVPGQFEGSPSWQTSNWKSQD